MRRTAVIVSLIILSAAAIFVFSRQFSRSDSGLTPTPTPTNRPASP